MTPDKRARALYDRLFRLGQFSSAPVVADPLVEIVRVIREAEDELASFIALVTRAAADSLDAKYDDSDTSLDAQLVGAMVGAVQESANRIPGLVEAKRKAEARTEARP